MIKTNYIYPLIFLVLPTLLALGLFIEQKVLSHGSYIYELQESEEWYNKDLDLKDKSWEDVKVEIKILKDTLNKVSNNFAIDTYDKNSLHVLTMQFHKKMIVLKHYLNTMDSKDINDYEDYKSILNDVNELLNNLISYNNNTIKPDYTTEFANIVNIIYLPLAVITGYFGMNFASMGAHNPKQSGVFNENQGQFFVLTVSIIVITIYMYIMYETSKRYGAFEYLYKGSNKFTLNDYIYGTSKKDLEKIERDKKGEKIKEKYIESVDENGKEYTIKNPPPSLKIYKEERQSLAPPIIRKDDLGPYDESLFDYKL